MLFDYQSLSLFSSDVANKLGLIPPIAEQCQHKSVFIKYGLCISLMDVTFLSMFHRDRPEKEYV